MVGALQALFGYTFYSVARSDLFGIFGLFFIGVGIYSIITGKRVK